MSKDRKAGRGRGSGSHARRPSDVVHPLLARDTQPREQPGTAWVPLEVEQACSSALQRVNGGTDASVAVTSSVRGEGRTTVALGVALAQLHEYGRSTVLLELDVERPSLARRFGLPPGPGLSDLLAGDAALEDCLNWPLPSLGVLSAGEASSEPARLLSRFARSGVVATLAEGGHAIVADLPPLPPTGPGDRVVDLFSAVLLVVRARTTPASAVRAAAAGMAKPPAVVLNGRASAVPGWLRNTLGG